MAREIRKWLPKRNPSQKLVWLLEHTYTPAGLSFAALIFWPKPDSVPVLSGAGSKTLVAYIRMQAYPSSHSTPGLYADVLSGINPVLQILLDALPTKKERPDYRDQPKQQIPDAHALAELFHVLGI